MSSKPYAIVQFYTIDGCQIYYGSAQNCEQILHNSKERVYGRFYDTQDQMLAHLNYLKGEKPEVIIHNLDEKYVA